MTQCDLAKDGTPDEKNAIKKATKKDSILK